MIEIIVSLVVILLLLFFGFLIVNHTFLFVFLYIENNLGSAHNPSKYPVTPLSRFIKNYWIELWYQLGKFYLWPLKFVNLTINRKKSKTAVLLIHGYCRDQSDWFLMRRHLRKTGLPIYSINLKPNLAPIQLIASTSLPKKIARIKQETNCKKIILVGHSMGGLVATYYSEFLDEHNLISAVITLGTPFYGTRVAIAGFGPNSRQMCPGTKFLEELRHQLSKSEKQYFQIATQLDNLVFPWTSALLENTPESHKCLLSYEAHLCLLHNQEVAKQLRDWLTNLS